jgi:hypothetical protein
MSVPPAPAGPGGEPSNRLPWIALGIGVLVIAAAVGVFFFNLQRSNQTVTVAPSVTPAPATRAASPVPSPTSTAILVALPATPTPSPLPTPTQVPVATQAPTPVPAPTSQPTPAPSAPSPTDKPSAPAPTEKPGGPPPSPIATPTFTGQVAAPGGLGNTRPDFDAASGGPIGETPTTRLVVYRRNATEYRVQFAPTDPPRAQLVIQVLPQNAPLQLTAAQAEARRLAPRDAQPRGSQPEGSQEFVVERFTSPTLARALPPDAFQTERGQPGDFIVVYLRNAQGAITHLGIAAGDNVDGVRASMR